MRWLPRQIWAVRVGVQGVGLVGVVCVQSVHEHACAPVDVCGSTHDAIGVSKGTMVLHGEARNWS